jgi:hypothetical protein
VHIDGTPRETVVASHYYFSHAFHTFTSCHLPSCSGLNGIRLFSLTTRERERGSDIEMVVGRELWERLLLGLLVEKVFDDV